MAVTTIVWISNFLLDQVKLYEDESFRVDIVTHTSDPQGYTMIFILTKICFCAV